MTSARTAPSSKRLDELVASPRPLSALRVVVLAVPLAYWLVFALERGAHSVWLAMVLAAVAASAAGLWWIGRGYRRLTA